MRKKLVSGVLTVCILAVAFIGWRFFSSDTAFTRPAKYLYIHTGKATPQEVMKSLEEDTLIRHTGSFTWLARQMGTWKKLRPGRYRIRKGMSLFALSRMLRSGRQDPVDLVITRLRTKQDLARLIGKKLECDSLAVMQFMDNEDSLRARRLDTNTLFTIVFPNTYTFFWNTTPSHVFNKFYAEYKRVWTEKRKQEAAAHELTPVTAYILASIIEEETNNTADKGLIASVYLNRLHKGMKLQADPTIKFALQNFSLRRIYLKYLTVESPYNTYRYTGLPPGPICTPSLETLDAVLQSPKTNYYFFVAKSDLSGRHVFSQTYSEHIKYARAYQEILDSLERKKQAAATEDIGH